ncbi:hypothetical protein Ancab_012063 [Ancistrocladus abbreviatus]
MALELNNELGPLMEEFGTEGGKVAHDKIGQVDTTTVTKGPTKPSKLIQQTMPPAPSTRIKHCRRDFASLGKNGIKECIDLGFGNLEWHLQYDQAEIIDLPRIKSDHRPLLLKLDTKHN